MTQTIYTNYWQNRLTKAKKEHGSYKSEEEAIKGIKAWWDLHKEKYSNVEYVRTNTGALEIRYDDDNYVYRVEKREGDVSLPSRNYKLRSPGEVEAQRYKLSLDEEFCLFDELAEPFRDRLVLAMADNKKYRSYIYDREGRPIREIS